MAGIICPVLGMGFCKIGEGALAIAEIEPIDKDDADKDDADSALFANMIFKRERRSIKDFIAANFPDCRAKIDHKRIWNGFS